MAELHKGTLTLTAKQRLTVPFPTKKGTSSDDVTNQLSAELAKRKVQECAGLEVEFEMEKGKPVRVRAVGQPWESPAAPRPSAAAGKHAPWQTQGPGRGGQRRHAALQHTAPSVKAGPPAFHNPYNFVPAPSRQAGPAKLGELADLPPAGHHRLHQNRWTGRIELTLETATPLLLHDAARATRDKNGHGYFPARVAPDGKPTLARTSFKGMLRAAYEAVTNSRFGVFHGHDGRLAYRFAAEEGLSLVPARFTGKAIELCLGTTVGLPTLHPQRAGAWQVPGQLMYAAWLPRYTKFRGQIDRDAVRYADKSLPESGDEVWVWMEKIQHKRIDRRSGQLIPDFRYWRVLKIARTEAELGGEPPQGAARKSDTHEPLGERIRVPGWVYVTNQNIGGKHDERVFFLPPKEADAKKATIALDDAEQRRLTRAWGDLIRDYQAAHRDRDIWERKPNGAPHTLKPEEYFSKNIGETAWSRHIYQDGRPRRDDGTSQVNAAKLTPGTLCYAFVKETGTGYRVEALYPVIIARKLYEASPESLLDESLRPATTREALSPAERVFGWAHQDGAGAYRGNLRVASIQCETDDAIESMDSDGVPLAILGEPKPQQSRFYAASNPSGRPYTPGTQKEATYRSGQGLRGRKVYPHHQGLGDAHWENPTEDRTHAGQEYRRAKGTKGRERDDQNRSVLSWVKPRAEFSIRLDVTNLSQVELGALLWLGSLDEGHYLRLGGGKPLGFGSVRLRISGLELGNGAAWARFYSSLSASSIAGEGVIDRVAAEGFKDAVQAFQDAVSKAYDCPFPEVSFIKAFLQGARGFENGLPTHYPRAATAIDPEGKNYEWFTENERGAKVALGALGDPDPGLPF